MKLASFLLNNFNRLANVLIKQKRIVSLYLSNNDTNNNLSSATINNKQILGDIKSARESLSKMSATTNNNERELLDKERHELEKEVCSLVEQLEVNKPSNIPKLSPEQVIRPKNEQYSEEPNKPTPSADKPKPEQKKDSSAQPAAKKKGGAGKEAPAPEKPIDISRLDLRVGKIVEVARHPDADSLYVEKIDCGEPSGARTVISGLVNHAPIEEMQNRLVLILCNLKPVKMRGILSEAMVMCASGDKVEILSVPPNAKIGDKVSLEQFPGEPDEQLNPKKKVWEQVAHDLKTNEDGVATYKGVPIKLSSVEGLFTSNLKNVHVR